MSKPALKDTVGQPHAGEQEPTRDRHAAFLISTRAHQNWSLGIARMLQQQRNYRVSLLSHPGGVAKEIAGISSFAWDGTDFVVHNPGQPAPRERRRRGAAGLMMRLLFPLGVMAVLGNALRLCFRQAGKPTENPVSNVGLQTNGVLRQLFVRIAEAIWRLPTPQSTTARELHWLLFGAFWRLIRQQRIEQAFARFIQDQRLDLLVLPEANILYDHGSFIAAARDADIPIVVFPYTLCGSGEWLESFSRDGATHVTGLLKRAAAHAFPEWAASWKGTRVMIPPEYILGNLLMATCPDPIWSTNSLPFTITVAEDELVRTFYRKQGVDTSSWLALGSIAQDVMHAMASTRERSGPSEGDHVVGRSGGRALLAMPPDQFVQGETHCGLENHGALMAAILSAAVEAVPPDWQILVSPHPRIDRAVLQPYACGNVQIRDEPIEHLIPLADVYVAVSSATIKWAIGCGIPVINLDAYGYDYDDYRAFEGVFHAVNLDEMRLQLHKLTNDRFYHAAVADSQRAASSSICIIDGNATKRLLALFDGLVPL